MELLVAGGLAGIGLLINEKQNSNNQNVYNNKITNNTEKKLVNNQFKQINQNPRIISRCYNRELMRDNNKDFIYSKLSGQPIEKQEFKHNNMQPFFGGSIKQNTNTQSNSILLENYNGSTDHNKTEVNAMFKPQMNMGNVNGFKNSPDNSRFKASITRQHEFPIESIKVGPGLNQKYGKQGLGGFQQFEIQELVKPKTVDELRVKSNPKLEYKGRINSGLKGKKRAEAIDINKNRPDTYYKNSPDRYFKTTGATLREKSRDKCYAKPTRRQNTRSYTGGAGPGSHIKPKKVGLYKKSTRNTYSQPGLRNLTNTENWSADSENSNYGKDSFKLPCNERDVTQKRTNLSNFATTVKALIAPIEDVFKTTRKENFTGNNRPEGNFNAQLPSKMTVYDPNDVARTTIKETNIDNKHNGNLNGPNKLTVNDPNDIARTTIKEINIDNKHNGNLNGPNRLTVYDPNDVAKTTIKETNIHNERSGQVAGPNKLTVNDPNDVARTTIKETNIENNHNGNLNGPNRLTVYDPNDIAKTTIKETNIHNERSGRVNGPIKLTVYDPNDIARTTIKETNIHNNRTGDMKTSEKTPVYSYDTAPKTTIRNTVPEPDKNINLNPQGPDKISVKDPSDVARTTIKETNLYGNNGNIERQSNDGYLTAPTDISNTNRQFTTDYEYTGNADGDVGKGGGEGYLTNKYEAPNTHRQFQSDYEYMGNADSKDNKPISYDDAYNASLNINKEEISVGRAPTKTSVKFSSGEDLINMEFKKLEKDIINQRDPNQNKIYQKLYTDNNCNYTNNKISLSNDMNDERIDGTILDTFRENPFTQSLSSH